MQRVKPSSAAVAVSLARNQFLVKPAAARPLSLMMPETPWVISPQPIAQSSVIPFFSFIALNNCTELLLSKVLYSIPNVMSLVNPNSGELLTKANDADSSFAEGFHSEAQRVSLSLDTMSLSAPRLPPLTF